MPAVRAYGARQLGIVQVVADTRAADNHLSYLSPRQFVALLVQDRNPRRGDDSAAAGETLGMNSLERLRDRWAFQPRHRARFHLAVGMTEMWAKRLDRPSQLVRRDRRATHNHGAQAR